MADDPTPPLVPLLLLLSVGTGLVDAVSVLGLGKVFTANMTGNIVFLGFAIAGAPGFSVAPSLLALLLFLAGAAIGGRIHVTTGPANIRRWVLTIALVEAALLTAAAIATTGYDIRTFAPAGGRYSAIALTALAMGLRNAAVRELKVPDLTTTVLTMTLTGIAADSAIAGRSNPNFSRRLASVIAMLSGAALGALLVLRMGLMVPLLLAAGIALIGTLFAAGMLPGAGWLRNDGAS
jgi:uncharacterized membrane protein YoaK (UPF0700 family)